MKRTVTTLLPLLPALLIYAYLSHQLNFTQDDAYISYRYVANYLNGDGLVYNIGERVEGFTNFGWVVYLILWGAFKAGYITVSKVTGFIFGAGVIVVTFLLARLVCDKRNSVLLWLAVLLAGVNQSLAYWSPAGLETAAFAFFASLSLYLYMTGHRLLIFSLVLSVLLRPEGVLVAGLLVIIEAIERRGRPKFSLRCALIAAVLLLPLAAFKILYYGSLLPNPFFAKTALSTDKLIDGLTYAGRFLAHYGFYGVFLLVPLLFYRKLSVAGRAIWLFTILYTVYIVLVGGDVLKVHRFFLPVIAPAAVLAALSLSLLAARLSLRTR
ncbi:MAG: hypothetical protein JSW34_03655, partial [Candidatus Zixiibacteriota bacterium]